MTFLAGGDTKYIKHANEIDGWINNFRETERKIKLEQIDDWWYQNFSASCIDWENKTVTIPIVASFLHEVTIRTGKGFGSVDRNIDKNFLVDTLTSFGYSVEIVNNKVVLHYGGKQDG